MSRNATDSTRPTHLAICKEWLEKKMNSLVEEENAKRADDDSDDDMIFCGDYAKPGQIVWLFIYYTTGPLPEFYTCRFERPSLDEAIKSLGTFIAKGSDKEAFLLVLRPSSWGYQAGKTTPGEVAACKKVQETLHPVYKDTYAPPLIRVTKGDVKEALKELEDAAAEAKKPDAKATISARIPKFKKFWESHEQVEFLAKID